METTDLGHWTTILEIPEDFIGFVYEITSPTGRKYIGKKLARTLKKYKPLKGQKRSRRICKDTNWKKYTGSSKELNEDIQKLGKENFSFVIIKFCTSKAEMAYHETKTIFDRDCLLSDDYYNNIVNIRLNGNCLKRLD